VRLLAIARRWERSDDGGRGIVADLEQLERDGTAAQLRAIAATLTAEEHERLRAEAASGDRLAALVTAVLATRREAPVVLRCRCGGTRWWPERDGKAERCVECGEWSPVSMSRPGPTAGAAKTRYIHADVRGPNDAVDC
jgi:hypothetical protein